MEERGNSMPRESSSGEAEHDEDPTSQGTPGMSGGHARPGIPVMASASSNEPTNEGRGEPSNDLPSQNSDPKRCTWVDFSAAEFPTIDFSALAVLS